MISATCNSVFNEAIQAYHQTDDVDAPLPAYYTDDDFKKLLLLKCWIDTVQWHLEDVIRMPDIEPAKALLIKRRIDASNQHRTDVVEKIDDHFLSAYQSITPATNATLNTESIGWAIDRLSILALKIYHMQQETVRANASEEHIQKCIAKLQVLLEQRIDLSTAIDELADDIEHGRKKMKVYRQMKMYNDASLNPALYKK